MRNAKKHIASSIGFMAITLIFATLIGIYFYNIVLWRLYPDLGFGFRSATGIKVVGVLTDVGEAAGLRLGDQIENINLKINELNEALRFYHIKVPRGKGRGFENKVSNVTDRAIMSSRFYTILIDSLSDMQIENLFGTITLESDGNFEGGLLVYGKYFGMIYTLFWKDQKAIQNQNMDELQANANLIIEQLLDIYDLMDFFF